MLENKEHLLKEKEEFTKRLELQKKKKAKAIEMLRKKKQRFTNKDCKRTRE